MTGRRCEAIERIMDRKQGCLRPAHTLLAQWLQRSYQRHVDVEFQRSAEGEAVVNIHEQIVGNR